MHLLQNSKIVFTFSHKTTFCSISDFKRRKNTNLFFTKIARKRRGSDIDLSMVTKIEKVFSLHKCIYDDKYLHLINVFILFLEHTNSIL
jgi:hypothetical protein